MLAERTRKPTSAEEPDGKHEEEGMKLGQRIIQLRIHASWT